MAMCCCRMSHVRAIQWLCDNVDDECDNNIDDDVDDDDDNDDGTVPGKLSSTAAVTSAPSAPHGANSPVGLLFLVYS